VLEAYCDHGLADVGIALVMNDHRTFVHPQARTAKCWTYDISHDTLAGPAVLDTPIGGYAVRIELRRRYEFHWQEIGQFFFLELEGRLPT